MYTLCNGTFAILYEMTKPVSGRSHSFHRAGRRSARKEQGSLCCATYLLRMMMTTMMASSRDPRVARMMMTIMMATTMMIDDGWVWIYENEKKPEHQRGLLVAKSTYNYDEEEVEDEKVKNLERTSTMVAVGRSVAVMSSSWERLGNWTIFIVKVPIYFSETQNQVIL